MLVLGLVAACATPKESPPTSEPASATTTPTTTTPGPDATPTADTSPSEPTTTDTAPPPLPSNRDRLILGYLAHLQRDPARTQSNGLSGADLTDPCDLWDALDPTAKATFLTITARLEGSVLADDGSTMLDHVVTAYRIVGGDGATDTDPGSCGGGEFNRVIASIDPVLHAALVRANDNKGSGPDIADIPAGGFWRDSHDLGGPHEPFTLSDETEDGVPRGQVQFFADPSSPEANAPLGRLDLEDLVDPWAFEMDHDYDCVHNSNPGCEYTFYGPLCLPEATLMGTAIYTQNYGTFDPTWAPAGC
jgi:hypothetical protein